MKTLLICGLLFLASKAHADYALAYDTSTKNVLEYGYQDMNQYKGNAAFGIISIKEDDAVLRNPIAELKFDTATARVIRKTVAERLALTQAARKIAIQDLIEDLIAVYQRKVFYAAEGFNVVVATTIIRNRINTLKTEYQTLP